MWNAEADATIRVMEALPSDQYDFRDAGNAGTHDERQGVSDAPPSSDAGIVDDRAQSRLELTIEGRTAFLAYERTGQTFNIVHTEVPPELRGRHLGDRLVEAALRTAHDEHLRLVVICPFARAYLRRHPQQQ